MFTHLVSNLGEHLSDVDWTVVQELSHIPRGHEQPLQEMLRREYVAYRKIHRDMAASLPPQAALDQAVFNIRRDAPDFQPQYDIAFFQVSEESGNGAAPL